VRARGNVSFVFSIRNKGITKLIFLINQVNNRLAETTSSLFFLRSITQKRNEEAGLELV